MSSIIAALSLVFKELLVFVAYVKNNAFPQPLQDTEEEKYLRLMAKGDPYARNKLIEHNLRLVAHIVKKFENTGEDSEDLISIGTIGLIKAIESYQVDKGTKLATYAARCIENEILKSKECLLIKSYEKGDPYGPFKLLSSDLVFIVCLAINHSTVTMFLNAAPLFEKECNILIFTLLHNTSHPVQIRHQQLPNEFLQGYQLGRSKVPQKGI